MDVRRIFVALVLIGAVSGSHEANAAGQAGWSGGTTQQPATNFDRYGQPATVPSITQRTQTAITDTGNSMRDGLDAGIRAGEQTLGIGNTQPQSSYANRGGSASPWPATSTANSNLVPIGSAAAPTAQSNGWSSIGTGIAAPKLLVPTSPMTNSGTYSNQSAFGTTSNFGNANSASTTNGRGPNFPAVAVNDQAQMHSVLSDPARSTAAATTQSDAGDWMKNWNNQSTTQNAASQPVTIGRNGGVREAESAPLNNGATMAQEQRGNNRDGWPNNSGAASTDPWGRSGNAQATTAGFGNSQPTNQTTTGAIATQPNNQGFNNGMQPNGQNINGYTQAGFGTNNGMTGNSQILNEMNPTLRGMQVGINVPTTTQPVFTWVLVVLALAASLAANFYLGASYLDSRQKYQSLVRKTAETFRRVKAAAT